MKYSIIQAKQSITLKDDEIMDADIIIGNVYVTDNSRLLANYIVGEVHVMHCGYAVVGVVKGNVYVDDGYLSAKFVDGQVSQHKGNCDIAYA
jgi:hypothetical protein